MASARWRGQRWTGLYRDADGRQRSAGTFGTREEALARAKVAEIDARPPEPELIYRTEARGKVTVAGYAPRWLDSQVLEPNTRDVYGSAVKHIVRCIGTRAVADVDPDDVLRLVKCLKKLGLKDGTIRNVLGVARLMLGSAARSGLREGNPADGIKYRVRDQRTMTIATREQARAIEDAMTSRYKLLVRALFATGCRWSEMIAVRGTDIEQNEGGGYVLKVRRTVNETWRAGLYEKPYGKSAKAKRDITIPKALAVDLMASGSGLCFADTRGGWLRRSDFRTRHWVPAVTKAGLKGFTVHCARHSAISWWANSDIPLASVRDRAGHSNIAITSRYIHVLPGDDPFLALEEAA